MGTYQQYMDAVDKADRDGNEDDARALYALAQQAKLAETDVSPQEPESSASDVGVGKAALLSVGRGFNNVMTGIQDGYYRATDDEEGLARLAQEDREAAAPYEDLQEKHPVTTFIGEGVGEALPLAPFGGLASMGAKSLLTNAGTKTAIASGLFAEGAAEGAITKRGDALDRVLQGALEGTANVVVGGAIHKAGGALLRRGQEFTDTRSFKKARELSQELAEKRRRVKTETGVDQDYLSSTGSDMDINIRERLQSGQDSAKFVDDFKTQQVDDAGRFNRELAKEAAGGKDLYPNYDTTQIGKQIQEALVSAKATDKAQMGDLYKKWAQAADVEGLDMDTTELGKVLGKLTDDAPVSASSTANTLKKVISRYNIGGQTVNPAKPINPFDKVVDPADAPKFKVSDYDRVMTEFNAMYSPTMAGGDRTLIDNARKALNDHMDTTALSAGGEAVQAAGKAARENAAKFYDTWDTKDVLRMITTTKDNHASSEFMIPDLAVVKKLTAGGNSKALKKATAALLTKPDALAALKAAPLLEAMGKAVGSDAKDVYGWSRHFEKSLKYMDSSAKEALWGKEFADRVGKAVVGQKNVLPAPRINMSNRSGTAGVLKIDDSSLFAGVSMLTRLFAPSGRAGGMSISSVPLIRNFVRGKREDVLTDMAEQVFSGKAPQHVTDQFLKEIDDELAEAVTQGQSSDVATGIKWFLRQSVGERTDDE